ncbi:MAG: RNA methyltransferase [Anaerolineae bacterium]
MSEPVITSIANPLIRRIRLLAQRKHREAEGAFFVEGIRPVWEAVESRASVEVIVIAPELLTSEAAGQMIEAQRRAGTRIVRVSPRVYEGIAERDHPSGLGALVRINQRTLANFDAGPSSFFVAVQDVGNPGNLGTIIRTVDGAGASGVILVGHSTDPYHPTAVKASMGTLFRVPTARVAANDDLATWCRSQGVGIITTSARAPLLYWAAPFTLPAVFLFGSEGEGLRDEEWSQGDTAIRIPMSGSADSLNLAVSVGVVLYEVKRRLAGQDPKGL